jgi:lysophospholipase L1-like esterase
MKRALVAAVCICMMGVAIATAQNSSEHWVATWGTAQNPARIPAPARATQSTPAAPTPAPATPAATTPPIPIAPEMAPKSSVVQRRYNLPPAVSEFNNQTLRQTLRTSIGGDAIRIRFYNAFGSPTLTLGAVHVALHAKDSEIVPSSDHAVTFSGKPGATIYAGQVLISDPLKMTVAPLADLAVSLYLPSDTMAPTTHGLGLRSAYTSGPGDFTSAQTIDHPLSVSMAYYWLEGVDVLAPADAAAIVTFGDSITDGDQSTPGIDAPWPSVLAARLQANKGTEHIAVVNEGISGNRVLGDNGSGLSRFAHEAIEVPGVKWITVLEGINDINGATRSLPPNTSFSADDLIAAYQQFIAAAHEHGIQVIGCTITPEGGSSSYKDAGETIRVAANDWIRAPGHFDAVVDFDKVMRNASDAKRFSDAAESPDLLHPGDAGYKMMGDAFDLKMFAGTTARGK